MTTICAGGAALLAACTRDDAEERMVDVDQSRPSPTGSVLALLVEDGDTLRPAIQDAESGDELWRDDLPHVERYRPGVLWEQDADVLWILSTDHGHASVREDSAGAWVKTMGSEGMPEDIAALAR
ncbi:hypothetical protein CJ197_10690 [Brachybacterium sp. UMB0905]|nr:hypothetical protein CJ197_10690 [Brachybacterium sp. UMB0905]